MASFASRVKSELQGVTRMPPHCRRAQNAARRIYAGGQQDVLFEPKKDCCARAFLRGAFLAAGTVSDPAKSYHLEITCPGEREAMLLLTLMERCGMEPKEMVRKGTPVVYIKEGQQVRDLLAMMGATVAMMDLENARILKGVRGNVNRRVNCETSNINKAVAAGMKQIRAIKALEAAGELDTLSDGLYDIAQARLAHPDATLEELGQTLVPPVSKSVVNHRLRKLCEMAEQL